MTSNKTFDLEERTFNFAKNCKEFIRNLPKNQTNLIYSGQLARSSGSVAANYIEANEALSKKDFFHRIKISKKESKESRLWLKLCDTDGSDQFLEEQTHLIGESTELIMIFSSIIKKNK